MKRISVVICTYNGSGWILGLFDSLAKQTLPESAFEILVVDNNSSDETRTIVLDYGKKLPNLRYLFEPVQGLSIARNLGVREASAPLVVYIDDDAIALPGWLDAIVKAFDQDKEVACVGGPVELDWQGPRPNWLPSRYESLYTCVDHGNQPRFLTEKDYLVGANIAFRREWLVGQGGFTNVLGRKGRCLLSGEEAAVFRNVFRDGKMAFYEPRAKIWHRVTPERKNRKWFYRRLFWDGATQPLLDSGTGCQRSVYLRGAWVDLRRCARFALEATGGLITFDHAKTIKAIARIDQRMGRFYMHLRLAFGGKV